MGGEIGVSVKYLLNVANVRMTMVKCVGRWKRGDDMCGPGGSNLNDRYICKSITIAGQSVQSPRSKEVLSAFTLCVHYL